MSRLTFGGLSSGINTDAIMAQLVRFNQQRIDTLKGRQTEGAGRQTILKTIETKFKEVQTSAAKLARSAGSVFDARKATSSDESLIKVAAGTAATPGIHTLRVNSIAKAHIVGSQGFVSSTSEINTGTLSISAGGSVANITIDGTNNTVKGLASAINAAKVGVKATIVKSGSGASPYKLLLTSEKTGVDNAISITNNLTTSSGTSTQPTLTTTIQAAQDAEIQIGSGADALEISNSSNIFTDVIEGVTINVQNADADKDVTITIDNDVDGIKTAVKAFVEDFNDVVDFIATQTKVDPNAKKAAALAGNRQLSEVVNTLRTSIIAANSLLSTEINRFSAFGISINRQGRIDFNEAKLDSLLNGEVDGVGIDEIKRGFAFTGKSTNTGISFITGTADTKESTAGEFEVDVTQAAETASITATNVLSGSTTINSSNNTLTIKIDGTTSSTITLDEGTYTDEELAEELQTRLRADSNIGRTAPTVSVSGNKLIISSARYGSSSEVSTLSGTAISSGILGFSGSESDTGVDVAGKFIVNGVDETATGSGRTLTGDEGNANTDGLRVGVTLSSSQLVSGVEGELTVTRGAAAKLGLLFEQILDLSDGRLRAITDKLQLENDALTKQIDKETKFLNDKQAALARQFAAMEDAIGKSRSSGDALTSSLSPLLSRR